MTDRRVVITGMGIVCSLGSTLDGVWDALLAGRSGITTLERLPHDGLKATIAGEVKNWDPTAFGIEKRAAGRMDLFCQFGVAAAKLAFDDAGYDPRTAADRSRYGCILGSGIGGLSTIEEEGIKLASKGPGRVSPFLIPKMMVNALSGEISIVYGLEGQNYTVVSACASSSHAIGLAMQSIRSGVSDLVLTGGSEAAITLLGMGGFGSMKALSTRNAEPHRASRPFDRERDGFVMGEGAGMLVIESEAHAKARGARIYAEVRGSGYNGDAHHITAPHPEGTGAIKAIRTCLADAKMDPSGIDYINAHGTSTEYNDRTETVAIKKVFGDRARKVAISSTKSMVGHLLGGSGGVEAIATALSIHRGAVHPTANLENPDPECDLDYVPLVARRMPVRAALSNSFGFGGHNVALCFARYA